MKIYTKTGDKGTTSLIGGKRVPKNHTRIEAYGTVDELIAYIGVVRDYLKDNALIEDMIAVQNRLMICAAMLATDSDNSNSAIPKLSEKAIVWLENKIDEMELSLTPITHFLLPGGNPAVSFIHVARTICRRAERRIIKLSETDSVSDILLKYINRLSDYLFVLARFVSKDLQADEITWNANLDK